VWLFGKFCGYLLFFVAICYFLWLFGIFCGYLVYFVAIWYVYFVAIWYIYFVAIWYTYCVAIWNILWLLGVFFWFWYVIARKIWQPCLAPLKKLPPGFKREGG
jgi:hypothetical protein